MGHSLAGFVEVMGVGDSSTQGPHGLEMLSAFIAVHSCTPLVPREGQGQAKGPILQIPCWPALWSQGQGGLGDFSHSLRASHMPSLYTCFGGRGTSVEVRGHLAGGRSLLPLRGSSDTLGSWMANPKPAGRLTACHRSSLGDFPPEGSVLQSGLS